MQTTIELQAPEWLAEDAPDALPIWDDVCQRLDRRKLLDAADPAAIAAYAYCLSESLRYERLGPGRTSHINPNVTVAGVWRTGAQFAGNRLAPLFPIVPVSYGELLLNDIWDELDGDGKVSRYHACGVTYRLDPDWQVEGADDL